MQEIVLPVVAHRIFGFGHSTGTTWSLKKKMPTSQEGRDKPSVIALHGKRKANWLQEESDDSGSRTHAYVAPGTRRQIDEIRDIFDGRGRSEVAEEGYCVNSIWGEAGIRFSLVAIIDHAIRSDHAIAMPLPEDDPHGLLLYARRFNRVGLVNFYFVRSLIGAAGVADSTVWPNDATKRPAYAALADYEDMAVSLMETGATWTEVVRVTAHELGHVLSLPHSLKGYDLERGGVPTNGYPIMFPGVISYKEFSIDPVEVMVARQHAKRYLPKAHGLAVQNQMFAALYWNDGDVEPLRAKEYLGQTLRFDDVSEEGDSQ